MTFTRTIVAALAALAVPSTAGGIYTGLYAQSEYLAPYVCVSEGALTLYWERDIHSGYSLVVGKLALGDGATSAVVHVHVDDSLWVRPGLQFSVGGGSTRTSVLVLAGGGEAPLWVDVFAPAVQIAGDLRLTGRLRLKEGGDHDLWLGPSYASGEVEIWWRYNFRASGSWEGGFDYRLLSW